MKIVPLDTLVEKEIHKKSSTNAYLRSVLEDFMDMNSLLHLCLEGLHTIDSVFGEETESFDRNRDRKMKELSSQFYFLRESS